MLSDHEDVEELHDVPRAGGYQYQLLRESSSAVSTVSPSQRLAWPFLIGSILGAAACGCLLFTSGGLKTSRISSAINADMPQMVLSRMACEGKHCIAFDCEKDKSAWLTKWSDTKKLYCCGMSCLAKAMKAKDAGKSHVHMKLLSQTHQHHLHNVKHLKLAHKPKVDHPKHPKQLKHPKPVPKLPNPKPPKQSEHTPVKVVGKWKPRRKGPNSNAPKPKDPNEASRYAQQPIQRLSTALKGISYCPVPVKATMSLKSDDWMTELARPLWSSAGRGDLHIIHTLGANAVRLYGNDPDLNKAQFLDEANGNELKVIPGLSDFPFFQDTKKSCVMTHYDCFSQVKEQYASNLRNGFLKQKSYHPSLSHFVLINEPDLKMPRTADSVESDAKLLAKAIVSSFDAVLDAEEDAQVSGTMINFTATFSYAICTACPNNEGLPALGQMKLIGDAMKSPEKYGYKPRHALYAAYQRRWVNSFNTANSAEDLKQTFFVHYAKAFPATPVLIGEYHNPQGPLGSEVKDILNLTKTLPLFLGISFFEFQVAYWKGGAEMSFGLFGLGGYPIDRFRYADGVEYTAWCLQPQDVAGTLLPKVLADAYGGEEPKASELCLPQPETVPLSELGYNLMHGQKDSSKMERFLIRLASHLGADVVDVEGCREFGKIYMEQSGPGFTFPDVVRDMQRQTPWLRRSASARCVANRNASAATLESAIRWGCAHLKGGCGKIAAACQTAFEKGDWIFSRYFQSLHNAHPLDQCNFGGAAIFASPKLIKQHAEPQCIV